MEKRGQALNIFKKSCTIAAVTVAISFSLKSFASAGQYFSDYTFQNPAELGHFSSS